MTKLIYFALALLLCQSTSLAHAYEPACERVAIDSVNGETGFRPRSIIRFSRAGGLVGPIVWVELAPPPLKGKVYGIQRMIVWWGRPLKGPVCKAGSGIGPDPAVNCAAQIPGTELLVDLVFKPQPIAMAKHETMEMVKYVSDEVLCETVKR